MAETRDGTMTVSIVVVRMVEAMSGRRLDDLHPEDQKYWHETAKAALKALQIPSHAMISAGRNASYPNRMETMKCWSAMIDAALSEEG